MRRVTPLASGLALAIAVAGSADQSRPVGPPPGRLVDIGGRSLHISCVGPATGRPTVILEAGAGDYSNRWTSVQDVLATRVRSCAYDRAGFGWSGGTAQSMPQDNADLRALLTATKVVGPYLLVGHSLGALLVRRYANHYPDGVVGMVLVGPTHENTYLFSPRDKLWQRMRDLPIGADFEELYLARKADPVPLGDRPLVVVVGIREAGPGVSMPADVAREKALCGVCLRSFGFV